MTKTNRRGMILGLGAAAIGTSLAIFGRREVEAKGRFEVTLTTDQWRRRLTPQQFRVLREQGTERAGSSPLDRERRAGTFNCAGCALPVFASRDKFDSGTGWPSFIRPIAGNVRTRPDRAFLVLPRTECHCRRCGGHLGHVFDDGPAPTGKRWCINGVALRFAPARA